MNREKKYPVRKILLVTALLLFLCTLRIIYLPVGTVTPGAPSDQKTHYDYKGVIHWHTRYSGDATGTYENVAAIANRQNVDFMISAEHNNLRALDDKKEGWHGNTLILVGVEITRPETDGHNTYLLGLNVKRFINTRQDTTDEVLTDIARQNGLAFIAHPQNRRWRWTGKIDDRIAGKEIVNFVDGWYGMPPGARITTLLSYPFNTAAAGVHLFYRPEETLKAWDEITKKRNFVGIYSIDFHQSVKLPGNIRWKFPKVARILPLAHNHIISSAPFSGNFLRDKALVYDALRKGHLYVALDALQDAAGFLFSARQAHQTAWMGDQLPAGKKTDFTVTLPPVGALKNTVIRLFHNGTEIAQSTEARLEFRSSLSGAYRVEVETEIPTFWGFRKKIVWIYSNPIYLR